MVGTFRQCMFDIIARDRVSFRLVRPFLLTGLNFTLDALALAVLQFEVYRNGFEFVKRFSGRLIHFRSFRYASLDRCRLADFRSPLDS